jgi:FkbM family methyltransferase
MDAVIDFKGFRNERGFLWPATDTECAAVVFDTAVDLDHAMPHVKGRSLVVQAGGNCGIWPRWLADRFDVVLTFEPDHLNFTALAANTHDKPNVIRMQSALGHTPRMIGLAREAGNCGAHFVSGGGIVPTIRIDDLALPACDLIVLDIVGAEIDAHMGAVKTIAKYLPVIVIEDKGLSERFGHKQGDAERWLAGAFGYTVTARPHRDVVLVCQ